MKVMVYPRDEGVIRALLIPGKRSGLPPVVVQGTDEVAVKAAILEAIKDMKAITPQKVTF